MMKYMKRIFYTLLVSGIVASCSLDKFPDDSINTGEAIRSVSDVQNFRIGLYVGAKNVFTGAYVFVPDIQADCYHAVDRFNGDYRAFYGYTVLAGEGICSNVWYGLYGLIANANFMIEGIKDLAASGNMTAAELKTLDYYNGDAHYMRAHFYYLLTEYFCRDYDPETAGDPDTGVIIVTKYSPSADSATYPRRSTLAETYKQILDDLDVAEKSIKVSGANNSTCITEDVVKALQALVALAMHDWQTAFDKAVELIEGGKYPLMSDAEAYAEGWTDDNLTETIWQLSMLDQTDVGNSAGLFINNSFGTEGNDKPQYVPEDWALDLYDRDNDIRYNAYFDERTFRQPVAGTMTLLVKYPGNPKYDTDSGTGKIPAYCNQPKVFRISEMYLIAAEAASNISGYDATASKYLNDLKSKRIANWTSTSLTGSALVHEIRNERVRELFGEGHRLNDLKRWHIGFQRSGGQDPGLLYNPGENDADAGNSANYLNCARPADDPLSLWPIPTTEVQTNPQMKQNPGYAN